LLAAAAGIAAEPAYPKVAGCPKFDTTSSEPVSMRYKFAAGQKVNFSLDTVMNMRIKTGGGAAAPMKTTTEMKMWGDYDVKKVERSGNADLTMAVTRMVIDASGGPQKVSFDSDKDADAQNPAFKGVRAMLNVPIEATLIPTGKVQKLNADQLVAAVEKSGSATTSKELRKSFEETMNSSFVPLPEGAVKAGDTYDAGEIVKAIAGVGELKSKVRYKVVAVSGDKKQVLLQPLMDLSVKAASAKVKFESTSMEGWVLFDVDKGTIARSAIDMKLVFTVSVGSDSARADMDAQIKFETTEP